MIGYGAGALLTNGGSNIFLGHRAGNRQTTNSNLLIVDNQLRADAATELTNAILYGTMAAAPANQTLRINAQVNITQGLILGYVAKTANYTLTANDYTVEATSGTFTLTLPTAVGRVGQIFQLKSTSTGIITLATTSSQLIDGALTQTMYQYENLTVQSNGANWILIH